LADAGVSLATVSKWSLRAVVRSVGQFFGSAPDSMIDLR
jgi:hypothetical protein